MIYKLYVKKNSYHFLFKIYCQSLLFITTCFGSPGHFQVVPKMDKILGRLTAKLHFIRFNVAINPQNIFLILFALTEDSQVDRNM